MEPFDVHVTMRGADLDPERIPMSLSGSVKLSSRRGDLSSSGTVHQDSHVVVSVASLAEAASAVGHVRALQPDRVDDAECVVGYWFDGQCNLHFSEVELAALAAERVSLSISCYPEPDIS